MNFLSVTALNSLLLLTSLTFQNTFALRSVNEKLNSTDFPFSIFRGLELNFRQGHGLTSFYDVLRGPTRFFRDLIFSLFNLEKSLQHNEILGKVQREIPADTPFPCNLSLARSITPPTTVHKLRPGDIDIIAVIGDSMSAGTNVMTENILQILYENRGITFSGGGLGTWRQFLTLPNILKVFNPNLYGYAIADGFSFHSTSVFNVAEPVAMSRDLVHQAKILIKRMRQDPNVDFENHWKLITIFIGNVDFCADYCIYDDVSIPLRYHEKDLRQCLTLLRDNVPRLYVNLISAPNSIWIFKKMNLSLPCFIMHHSTCFCVASLNQTDHELKEYERRIHLWQDLDAHMANLPEFNTDNFTIVYHNFFNNPQTPLLPDGSVDPRYFGADCFHLSQLGHAALANTLWNSMMQPDGHKESNYMKAFERFECPSLERPYLATKNNSIDFGL